MIETARDTNPPPSECITTPRPRVAAIARQRLRQSPYAALRSVECEFREGVLVLAGRVPTFHLKQLAQTVVQDLNDVNGIDNRLIVPPH